MLVFALNRLLAGDGGVVPVLSTGEVPMSNMAFPQGIFLGRPKDKERTAYLKFSLFRPASRKTLVSLQGPFTAEDIARARESLEAKPFLPFEQAQLRRLLAEICARPEVLDRHSYADQATVFNARLWPRLFNLRAEAPRLIELDKAELARRLLIKDLFNAHSLARALLFEPAARRAVLAALNRTPGCWNCPDEEAWATPEQGTVFFWGLDRQGRAFALGLDAQGCLVAPAYPDFRLAFTPMALAEALQRKHIFPGLFLSFAALALARGLMCCGGAYQSGYLVHMRNRAAAALNSAGEAKLAELISGLPTAPMTTGLMPLRFKGGEERAYPAGPVEIMAAGGLGPEHLEAMAGVTAPQAFGLYVAAHYEDIIPTGKRIAQWVEHLAAQGGVVLEPAASRAG